MSAEVATSGVSEEVINPILPQNMLARDEFDKLLATMVAEDYGIRSTILYDHMKLEVTFETKTYKLLAKEDSTIMSLLIFLRRKITLGRMEGLVLFCGKTLYPPSQPLRFVFDRNSQDGVLEFDCKREVMLG